MQFRHHILKEEFLYLFKHYRTKCWWSTIFWCLFRLVNSCVIFCKLDQLWMLFNLQFRYRLYLMQLLGIIQSKSLCNLCKKLDWYLSKCCSYLVVIILNTRAFYRDVFKLAVSRRLFVVVAHRHLQMSILFFVWSKMRSFWSILSMGVVTWYSSKMLKFNNLL